MIARSRVLVSFVHTFDLYSDTNLQHWRA